MQKKKKGFTLVELLVVIAILAILSAVSVVGYLSFTEKAKESNDNTLVTQLNTVLQADEASDGKPKTMSDALGVLRENGFLVENLTPSSAKNEFLYNLKENRFEIKTQDEVKSLNNGDYWYIVEDETALNDMKDNCSLYLIDGLSLTNTEILDIKYGFDSLNNNVSKLTITNNEGPSDIVVNTNAANIEINAADDNVSHYGTADNVTVTAVANNSYHEYGEVSTLHLLKGRVVVENKSTIDELIIDKNANLSNIKVKINENGLVCKVISSNSGNIEEIIDGYVDQVIDSINVSTFDELQKSLKNAKYIILNNDINFPKNNYRTYLDITTSTIINGNGHSINGYVYNNDFSRTFYINGPWAKLEKKLDVTIKNLTINNNSNLKYAGVIETCGFVNSLILENVIINANLESNTRSYVIMINRGNDSSPDLTTVKINNSKINASNQSYPIMAYNPINLDMQDSYVCGYCCTYLSRPNNSYGSKGSILSVYNTSIDCPNKFDGNQDNFGVFNIEDEDITINLKETFINAKQEGSANQSIIMLSDYPFTITPTYNRTKNIKVVIEEGCFINGKIMTDLWSSHNVNTSGYLEIVGGVYVNNPETYVDLNLYDINISGGLYKVTKK